MAEPAVGAVSLLLGVIRKEAELLGGVGADVQFIREEMESMRSFLAHLSRTAPPDGEHNEQVRTWMEQVRRLALDCSNCIDLYLHRGNPATIHRARGGLRGCVWRLPWFLRKMVAQHHAAIQLRELKDRARDVSERRSRYGVEVPAAKAAAVQVQSPHAHGRAAEPSSVATTPLRAYHVVGATSADDSGRARGVEDYFDEKLAEWMMQIGQRNTAAVGSVTLPSIAVVARDPDKAHALAHQALAEARSHLECSVLVDIAAVHLSDRPLEAEDILYYILWQLKKLGEEEGEPQDWRVDQTMYIRKLAGEIQQNVTNMQVDAKIGKIQEHVRSMNYWIRGMKGDLEQMNGFQLEDMIRNGHVGLALLLLSSAAVAEQEDRARKRTTRTLAAWYDHIVKETARKLQRHIEEDDQQLIRLDEAQYAHILQEVFPMASNSQPLQQGHDRSANKQVTRTIMATTGAVLAEDQMFQTEETIHKAAIFGSQSDSKQAASKRDGQSQITDPIVEETIEKTENIKMEIKQQLKVNGIANLIKEYLEHTRTLIILKVDEMTDGFLQWEETRKALSLTGCVAGAVLIFTTTTNIQQAKECCHPPREPIDCSLVGLYHDAVLELTSQQVHEDNNYDPRIFREILDMCEQHEFCMKIFVHALYANPKRSNEVLRKLLSTLQVSPKSLGSIAKNMIKFSYDNLPEEYRSCLLYLAIFPQGYNIRRSMLIRRWVVEGLITKEDWTTSVHQAERCFDALTDQWLVCPADIGAMGKIKSCMVVGLVHGFIFKIATRQHIVETSLSHHLTRHFSIFNNLHLRASDTVYSFLRKLSQSSQMSLLKVLDLEGCHYCFSWQGKRQLKNICRKMLLLKYLSLRNTDVKQLPNEINNLHDLEVLDIRETNVPVSATKNLLLLKLKHLLAGRDDSSPSSIDSGMAVGDKEFSSVCVPDEIEKMSNMEVLSNVMARNSRHLRDIGSLWRLRKLGVVITDKDRHITFLLHAMSDLHESLRSLSITLAPGGNGTPSSRELPSCLMYPLKLLESLSITGTTQMGKLLPLLAKYCDELAKVTLQSTCLNQEDLKVPAKLPKLRCFRLQKKAYTQSKLTFLNDEFQNLKYFLVEGSNMTEISFGDEATRELEKIVLSFTDIESIYGVDALPKMEELELNNNTSSRLFSSFASANQIAKLTLRGTLLEQGDLQILAKKPNVRSLVLSDKSCKESQLTFTKDEFPRLNILIVQCSDITKINFTSGSALKLEKIEWTFTKMESLLGINNLPRLKELKFNGDPVDTYEVEEDINKLRNRPGFHFKHK